MEHFQQDRSTSFCRNKPNLAASPDHNFPDICLRNPDKRPHYTDQATIQVASLLQPIALETFATPKTAEPEAEPEPKEPR